MPRGLPCWDTEQIERDRLAKGWTVTELAARADLYKQTVSKFLMGENNSIRAAYALATALGEPVTKYLLNHTKRRRRGTLKTVVR